MKTVTCKASDLTDHTGNRDLEYELHHGFTIGRGKKLYWYFRWHGSGNATVYPVETDGNIGWPRTINTDTEITIHFK